MGLGHQKKSFMGFSSLVIQQDLLSFGNTQQSFCFTAPIFHQIRALGSPHGRQKILGMPSSVLWDISQGRCCFSCKNGSFPSTSGKKILVFWCFVPMENNKPALGSHPIAQFLEPKPGICSHLQKETFSGLKNAIFVQPCSHPLC